MGNQKVYITLLMLTILETGNTDALTMSSQDFMFRL